jgi:hypothetical protein
MLNGTDTEKTVSYVVCLELEVCAIEGLREVITERFQFAIKCNTFDALYAMPCFFCSAPIICSEESADPTKRLKYT